MRKEQSGGVTGLIQNVKIKQTIPCKNWFRKYPLKRRIFLLQFPFLLKITDMNPIKEKQCLITLLSQNKFTSKFR